jgi:hypothetical protein
MICSSSSMFGLAKVGSMKCSSGEQVSLDTEVGGSRSSIGPAMRTMPHADRVLAGSGGCMGRNDHK